MSRVLAADLAYPPERHSQEDLSAILAEAGEANGNHFPRDKVAKFFSSVQVSGRHLVLPPSAYRDLGGVGRRNAAWTDWALRLGQECVSRALARGELPARDVKLFISSTVTGVAAPSIEARLMHRLSFSPSCRRAPLFGLGCVAGAAGMARAHDYLVGHPSDAALLLCVELCSLTFQPHDSSVANVIACALFGDGAGCALMVGDEHPLGERERPTIVDTRSVLFPDSERLMGWDVVDTGFRVVLGSGVPELARTALSGEIRSFLADHGLRPGDVHAWIGHPGGPAVLDALERGLELPHDALNESRACLSRVGNLSSVSVLAILQTELGKPRPPPGTKDLLFAMGPGFCAELVLLEW